MFTFDELETVISDFAQVPSGFNTATTSGTEWLAYCALAKVLGVPADPKTPPFIGFPGKWLYQKNLLGGRRMAGGVVADFVILAGNRTSHNLLIRVVTEHFHIFTNSLKQQSDERQLMRLQRVARVEDVLENDLLGDPSGEKPCRTMAEALAGISKPNPLASGTQRRYRGWRP